jgi:hypothetical protein
MAQLNEILVGRFNRGLQKIFGIKGRPPVSTLAPEIMPVHNIPNGVESRYLETWNRYSHAFQLFPGAAATGVARFLNPTGSGTIAVFERILYGNGAALSQLQVTYGTGLPNLPTLAPTAVSLDGRNTASSNVLYSSSVASPAAGPPIILAPIANNQVIELLNPDENCEIALPPGFALSLTNLGPNIQFFWTVFWRERFLEEGERL